MAKKLQVIGSSLIITDTISSKIDLEIPKRDAFHNYEELEDNSIVRIYNTVGKNFRQTGLFNADLVDCVDVGDVVFTKSTFLDFVRNNLGFNAASGGSGAGWTGRVEFRADLPITLVSPAIGEIYLVEKPTTILFGAYTTQKSGLYIKDTDTGSLNDWRDLGIKLKYTDGEWRVVSAADQSKQGAFNLALLTTGTTRTLNWPDKSGTIALLSDITPSLTFNVDLDGAESSVVRVVAGGRTTFTITHNLNTLDLKPEVFRLSNGRTMGWRIERTGVNEVEASRSGNVANGLFRILI